MGNYWLDRTGNVPVNPIVDFTTFNTRMFATEATHTLPRKSADLEPFLYELEKLMDDPLWDGDAKHLYEKYPEVRVGLRRAIVAVKERNK